MAVLCSQNNHSGGPLFFIIIDQVAGMKRFLMFNADNQKWVDAQEKRCKSQQNVETISKLVRRECFPQLLNETISTASSSYVPEDSSSSFPKGIAIEARQRQLHRSLMKELLKLSASPQDHEGKQKISLYRTFSE